ncbi:MAG: hypothetical protein ABIV36_19295 [Sphingobium limneticum]
MSSFNDACEFAPTAAERHFSRQPWVVRSSMLHIALAYRQRGMTISKAYRELQRMLTASAALGVPAKVPTFACFRRFVEEYPKGFRAARP